MVRRPHGVFAAASRRPLTAAVRQTCNSCKDCEVAVRSPPCLLAVTLQFLISWIVRSSCGHRNICDHNYRRPQDLAIFKKSRFTSCRPQNRTVTVSITRLWGLPIHQSRVGRDVGFTDRYSDNHFFALLDICAGNSPISGEFPAQRPVTRRFHIFIDLHLNTRLGKQLQGWWFGDTIMLIMTSR